MTQINECSNWKKKQFQIKQNPHNRFKGDNKFSSRQNKKKITGENKEETSPRKAVEEKKTKQKIRKTEKRETKSKRLWTGQTFNKKWHRKYKTRVVSCLFCQSRTSMLFCLLVAFLCFPIFAAYLFLSQTLSFLFSNKKCFLLLLWLTQNSSHDAHTTIQLHFVWSKSHFYVSDFL